MFRWIDAGPEDAETIDRHEPGRVFIDRGDSAHARWASAMADKIAKADIAVNPRTANRVV